MELLKKHVSKHIEKVRFGIVGVANTALDFAILFILVSFGLDKLVANFFSTSIAFIFSFFVNKSFTFKSSGGNLKKQLVLFIAITAVALWVIQPLVITAIAALLSPLSLGDSLVLFIGKLVATVASLIWNYIFYSRFVFKKSK
jgi:putative flippase GtrA